MGSPWVTLYSHKQGTLLGGKRPKKDDMAFCCYQKCPVQLDISCSCTKLVHYCSSSHQVTPYCRHTKKELLASRSSTLHTENSNFFFYFETPFIIKLFVQYHKKIDKEIGAKGKSLCSQVLPFQKLRFLQIFCFYSLRL